MSWHFLERWLEKANQHSTLIGKFWITFLIVCRLIIIGSLGDRVYADEQSEFKCNSAQMGCNNVCFDNFSPISHVRFWGFQILAVTFPSIIFLIYTGHKTKEAVEQEKSKMLETKKKTLAEKKASKTEKIEKDKENGDKAPEDKRSNKESLSTTNDLPTKFPLGRRSIIKSPNLDPISEKLTAECPYPMYITKMAEDLAAFKNKKKELMVQRRNSVQQLKNANSNNNTDQIKRRKSTVELRNRYTDYIMQKERDFQTSRNFGSQYYLKNQDSTSPLTAEPEVKQNKKELDPSFYHFEVEVIPLNDLVNLVKNNNSENISMVTYRTNDKFESKQGHLPQISYFNQNNNNNKDIPNWSENPQHKLKKFKKKDLDNKTETPKNEISAEDKNGTNAKDTKKPKQLVISRTINQHFLFYFIVVILRLAAEIIFLMLQARLFGFKVARMVKCSFFPCPGDYVDCFISRATEKTIFLNFMFGFTMVCVFLNVFEIVYLIGQIMRKHRFLKKMQEGAQSARDSIRNHAVARKDEKIKGGKTIFDNDCSIDLNMKEDEKKKKSVPNLFQRVMAIGPPSPKKLSKNGKRIKKKRPPWKIFKKPPRKRRHSRRCRRNRLGSNSSSENEEKKRKIKTNKMKLPMKIKKMFRKNQIQSIDRFNKEFESQNTSELMLNSDLSPKSLQNHKKNKHKNFATKFARKISIGAGGAIGAVSSYKILSDNFFGPPRKSFDNEGTEILNQNHINLLMRNSKDQINGLKNSNKAPNNDSEFQEKMLQDNADGVEVQDEIKEIKEEDDEDAFIEADIEGGEYGEMELDGLGEIQEMEEMEQPGQDYGNE